MANMQGVAMNDEQWRTPTDGKPFYCLKCKKGFSAFADCVRSDCKIESEESAEIRQFLCASKAK